jgi:hypothetical protein
METDMRFISAAQSIHDAYAMHLSTPESSQPGWGSTGARDNGMRIVGCIEAGKIIAVVEALPCDVRDWLMFAYGPGTQHFAGAAWRVATELWQRIDAELSARGGVRAAKRKALAALCMIAAQDYRAKVARGRGQHQTEVIAKLLRVPASNYQRDYGPWIERMELMMEAWDREGRRTVGVVVAQEREKYDSF